MSSAAVVIGALRVKSVTGDLLAIPFSVMVFTKDYMTETFSVMTGTSNFLIQLPSV